MQFNVNDGVVKMLELLASNKSLQAFVVILASPLILFQP